MESKPRGSGCYDMLIISSSDGAGIFCGKTAPGRSLHVGDVTIQFRSDIVNNFYSGFKLNWRFVKAVTWDVTVYTGKHGTKSNVYISVGNSSVTSPYQLLEHGFKPSSNTTNRVMLPVNVLPKPNLVKLKTKYGSLLEVIQVNITGAFGGNRKSHVYPCNRTDSFKTICRINEQILV
ncbi:uncharacterized protein LOC141911274 isoform X2 [Tubulanus polymorphus]|uniref:uncharacterized protein LOC141911274 isoform X2 n=1 Tax=Tubulanus polymorphus TaxID=672921 RepID=UPI003DA63780